MAYLHNLIKDEILDEFLEDEVPSPFLHIQKNSLEPTKTDDEEENGGPSQNISEGTSVPYSQQSISIFQESMEKPKSIWLRRAKLASLVNSMKKEVKDEEIVDVEEVENENVHSETTNQEIRDEDYEKIIPQITIPIKVENVHSESSNQEISDEDFEKIIPQITIPINVENVVVQLHEENPGEDPPEPDPPKNQRPATIVRPARAVYALRQANGIWICQECSKPFMTEIGAKRHHKTKHAENKEQHMPKKIKTENTTYQKIEQQTLPEAEVDDGEMIQRQTDGRWQCGRGCTKTFKFKHLAKIHVKHIHKGLKKYACQKCDKFFTESHSLKSHNQLVHEKPQLDVNGFWQCNWGQACTKTYKSNSKQLVQRHIDNVHKGLKKYACQQCDKSYTQSHSLKSHVQIVHEKVSPFVCVLCGNSFKQRITIKRHMKKVHSGVDVKPEAAEDEEDMEVKMKSDKHLGKSWVLIGIVYNFLSSSRDLITIGRSLVTILSWINLGCVNPD